MTSPKFKVGDRVRLPGALEVVGVNSTHTWVSLCTESGERFAVDPKEVERIDDPASDLVGTVRRRIHSDGELLRAVKTAPSMWRHLGSDGFFENDEMSAWDVEPPSHGLRVRRITGDEVRQALTDLGGRGGVTEVLRKLGMPTDRKSWARIHNHFKRNARRVGDGTWELIDLDREGRG